MNEVTCNKTCINFSGHKTFIKGKTYEVVDHDEFEAFLIDEFGNEHKVTKGKWLERFNFTQ